MIAFSLLAVLVLGSPDIDGLLAAGRFAEAEAEAKHTNDTSALAEVWFRAGLYERVLSMPATDVAHATSRLHFRHRQAAAAVRLEHTTRAEEALVRLAEEIDAGSFATDDERVAWTTEVQAFETALDEQRTRSQRLSSALTKARVTVFACLFAGLLLIGFSCRVRNDAHASS